MSNRIRKNDIHIHLSDDEKRILESKYKESGLQSVSAYIRHLILYGYAYDIDYSHLKEHTDQIRRIGVNINQIVRMANMTRTVSSKDISELKKELDKIWQLQRSILLEQPLINQ